MTKKETDARYREKNRERLRVKRRQDTEWVWQFKRKPCMDCGIQYDPWVMDFDHRPNETKSFQIGAYSYSSLTKAKLLQEINKCDVVCANCHRVRTYKRIIWERT